MRVRSFVGIVFVCVSAFAGVAFGQEGPKAVLVDDHGQLPCEDSLGRLSAFYGELASNPGDQGLIVVSARPEQKHLAVFTEGMIRNHIRQSRVDPARFDLVRALSEGDLMVQFWRIPQGANRPLINNVDGTALLPSTIKPFMLGREYAYEDGICPEVDDFRVFVAFLKSNPQARGNVVVREQTRERAGAKGRRLLREFGSNGIARSRLRVFTGTRAANDYNVPVVEYWFLP